MRKYLLNTLLFSSICIVLAFGFDMFLSARLRTNKNRIYANWNQIYNASLDYDLVINGNSRAWVQYDPFIIDSLLHINCYNLGIDGSPINRQIIKYQKYCNLHKAPKYLIQNIDFCTMDIRYGYEREQFFPYFFYDRKLILAFDKYENFSILEKYLPCYRYLGYEDFTLESFFNNNQYGDELVAGYHAFDKDWDGTNLVNLDSIECACDTNMINMFDGFLEREVNKGVKIIFVYAPIYFEARQKLVNEKKMFEMYDSIARKFDITILDYNDMPMCYDTTYFYNATHLNRIGAELFTTKLAYDIDSLGLLK